MGYEDEKFGDRGLLANQVDFDEFDELAALDMDDLEEMGATSCPPGETYDRIEQMCRPDAKVPMLKAKFMYPVASKTAPVPTSQPAPAPAPAPTQAYAPRSYPPKVQYPATQYPSKKVYPTQAYAPSAPAPAPPPRRAAPVELLQMPEPPPSTAKVVGLSRNGKIGLGVAAGALLLYIATRK